MTFIERWFHRPQNVWLRRALFQVHLWTGIGIGLYIFAICVSGSALVFRTELIKSLWPDLKTVVVSGPKLTPEVLTKIAERAHPHYVVANIWDAKQANQATEIWLDRGQHRIEREFDPYTGEDLGRRSPYAIAIISWLTDLHGNLLNGSTGRTVNGVGAIFLVLLAATGAVIWWPGIETWRRNLTIDWKAPWKRLNWDLHSAVGFWTLAIVFMWGFTGTYLIFPDPITRTVNRFSPLDQYKVVAETNTSPQGNIIVRIPAAAPADSRERRLYGRTNLGWGDKLVRWFSLLHYGTFGGWGVKSLWVALGLIPPFLFVTGAIMWWNRVVSPYLRRHVLRKPSIEPARLNQATSTD